MQEVASPSHPLPPNILLSFPSFSRKSFHTHNNKCNCEATRTRLRFSFDCSSSSNLSARRIYPFAPFKQRTLHYLISITMQSHSDSPDKPTNPLSQLAQNMFSDNNSSSNNNNTIMLAAIVSLLLVILFVLLLHLYAKWFLAQTHQPPSRGRRRRRSPVSVSGGVVPPQFHHFHNISIEGSPISTKGLESSVVSRIPMFVYEAEVEAEELECVICLSAFEEGEIGRSLPKCGHVFHVECIDMWLSSHCNCPICRAPIVCGVVLQNDSQLGSVDGNDDDGVGDDSGFLEIVIGTPSYEISESERGNDSFGGGGVSGSVSETSLSLLGCSLKRMLSKVFLSSNLNELDGSQ